MTNQKRFNKHGLALKYGGVLLCWLCLAPISARGEVIDRIVAIVDKHIITMSDLRLEHEVLAALHEKADADDDAAVQRIIENYLIESQTVDAPGVDVTEAEVDEYLKNIQAGNVVPAPILRDAIRKRIRMSKYFEVRFRQFLPASNEEVRKYYDEIFVPEAEARHMNPIPAFEDVVGAVRQNVIEEKLDHEVNIWLEALRRRSSIEIVK